ncbi:hypothetical protein LTR62_008349 [Meristemomyces frigidus]|uniref:Uncharacterized protein n=1 Tax=Meristemomyces frigidus TaxID=1508187 RepID=A0AAN7TA03_9PEZI|nr:hypothetical protein LTR62_008349 [Meristemomyces frigidus]
MASLRALVPRASLTFHSKQLQHRLILPSLRNASTTPPPKPRLLEKPERFNPPSHPSRIRSKPKYYGAPLSEHERQAQKVRKYPHMMPPQGSFMFWFLTDRNLHLYITLGVLFSLVGAVWYQDFMRTTPYADLLPPNNMIFAHPFAWFHRWWEVYSMHIEYISAQTAEKRKAKADDVQKRAAYRKAHGIGQEEGMFGGWTAREGPDAIEAAATKEGSASISTAAGAEVLDASPVAPVVDGNATYVDFEGKPQPAQKKWLGIW